MIGTSRRAAPSKRTGNLVTVQKEKTPGAALRVEGLSTGYGRISALEDITFQLEEGEILGVIGPNGSGKSTLMKSVLGLVKPWKGSISVLGRPAHQQKRLVGYMPQAEQVDWDFPVSVADVARMGRFAQRGLLRWISKADREKADAALEKVDMYRFRDRLIGELSGGQRRRVLLARALASDPRLLLMDEPMAGLDARAQHRLLDMVDRLRSEGTTIVMSTHDLSCVSVCAGKVACLNRRLIAFGEPDSILTEEVLNQTFGTHLLMVHMDGQAYAYQHHAHSETDSPATPQ